MDAELLKPGVVDAGIGATSEEILAESYEQVRLSVSHWLQTPAKAPLVRQIERLRAARAVLPLWELEKRLEYLLMPEVYKMVTTEGDPRFQHRDVLRRDCLLQTTEADCKGGCVWRSAGGAGAGAGAGGGKCLIHTTDTPRYKDPIRLLTVRLVTEFLETFDLARELLEDRVSAITPLKPGEIVKSKGSVLFGAPGGSSAELLARLGYDQRKPTAFTRGLTYPEEVSREPERGADYDGIAPAVARAGLSPAAAALAMLAAVLGKTATAIEAELGRPFTFSVADWQWVADTKRVGVVLHFVDHQSVVVDRVLRPDAAAAAAAVALSYLLVSYDNRLMQSEDGTFLFPEDRLPASVRAQLN
jgi:hypothetical protein